MTKVKLTRRTFYERVHPAVNELEFSAGDGEFGKFGIKLGQVHFGLNYDNVKNILRIKIYEAKDLPAADEGSLLFKCLAIKYCFLEFIGG